MKMKRRTGLEVLLLRNGKERNGKKKEVRIGAQRRTLREVKEKKRKRRAGLLLRKGKESKGKERKKKLE